MTDHTPPTTVPSPIPSHNAERPFDAAVPPVWGMPRARDRSDLTPTDAAALVCEAMEAQFDAARDLLALLHAVGHFVVKLPRGYMPGEIDAVLVVSRLVAQAEPMAERLVEDMHLVAADFLPRIRPVSSSEGK